jgi:hypothetical protein
VDCVKEKSVAGVLAVIHEPCMFLADLAIAPVREIMHDAVKTGQQKSRSCEI